MLLESFELMAAVDDRFAIQATPEGRLDAFDGSEFVCGDYNPNRLLQAFESLVKAGDIARVTDKQHRSFVEMVQLFGGDISN